MSNGLAKGPLNTLLTERVRGGRALLANGFGLPGPRGGNDRGPAGPARGDPEFSHAASRMSADLGIHDTDPDVARDRIVDDWWSAKAAGVQALMLAAHHRQVDDLNTRARQRMRSSRRLSEREVVLGGRALRRRRHRPRHPQRLPPAHPQRHPRHRHGDRRDRSTARGDHRRRHHSYRAVRLRRSPPADPRLRHDHPQDPGRHRGCCLGAGRRDHDPRAALHGAVSWPLRNIIYVSASDLRAELAHVAEAGREPLQALIEIIARTDAKEMAIEGSRLTL